MSVVTTFSVREIPFSYAGSWFDISPVIAEKTYADDLHLVSHRNGMHAVLRFATRTAGEPVAAPVTASATRLRWTHESGFIDLVYETADTVRLRGAGLGLRIGAAA